MTCLIHMDSSPNFYCNWFKCKCNPEPWPRLWDTNECTTWRNHLRKRGRLWTQTFSHESLTTFVSWPTWHRLLECTQNCRHHAIRNTKLPTPIRFDCSCFGSLMILLDILCSHMCVCAAAVLFQRTRCRSQCPMEMVFRVSAGNGTSRTWPKQASWFSGAAMLNFVQAACRVDNNKKQKTRLSFSVVVPFASCHTCLHFRGVTPDLFIFSPFYTSHELCWFIGRKYEFLKLAEPLMNLAVFLSHNPNGWLVCGLVECVHFLEVGTLSLLLGQSIMATRQSFESAWAGHEEISWSVNWPKFLARLIGRMADRDIHSFDVCFCFLSEHECALKNVFKENNTAGLPTGVSEWGCVCERV